ncbi:IS21-like element helper ATPase IstB [bacterium]|nr:IS21-like element helper ATPase IstB [bacterium]
MELIHQIKPLLRSLRLSGVMDTLEIRNQQAISEKISYLDFLAMLVQDEVERRRMKQLERRLKKARFSADMTLEDFDFSFNSSINRHQILDLATASFVERKENVFFIGPAGVGKTHLASALAHQACRRGFDVLFIKTSQLLRHLAVSHADGSWETKLAHYLKPDLLVLDDWGLKPLGHPAADDLYEIICERYERGSLIMTSNRTVEEWPELFGDPLLASASLDRLVHHSHIITITGKSFRAKKIHKRKEGIATLKKVRA